MVGKTATIRSILNKDFNPAWDSTLGISVTETVTGRDRWKVIEKADFTLSFVNRAAVKKLEEGSWKQEKRNKLRDEIEHLKHVGVGTHNLIEKEKRKIDKIYGFDGQSIEKATMQLDDIHISVWDYGGQTVFSTLHHLFLTKYGIYLLVFNMASLITNRSSARDYIMFWLNSITLHAPEAPILLVGTFLDYLKDGDIDYVQTEIQSCIQDKFPHVIVNGQLSFFPVDNRNNFGIVELKEMAEVIIRRQPYIQYQVSTQWMRSLDAMQRQPKSWLRLQRVNQIVQGFGISDEAEVSSMLSLFHELGVMLHFNATESLRDVIISKPQWLINEVSKVIRDSEVHRFDDAEITRAGLQNDVQNLFDTGLLSRDLLEFLWGREEMQFLMDLMRSLLLLCKWEYGKSEELFMVPSMVLNRTVIQASGSSNPWFSFESFHAVWSRATSMFEKIVGKGYRCDLDFEFLPYGVFERLICLCVDYSSASNASQEPIVQKNLCKVLFSDATVQLEKQDSKITFYVNRKAAMCLEIVISMFRKLKQEVMGEALVYEIKLQQGKNMISYAEARRNMVHPWFIASEAVVEALPEESINFDRFLSTF